MTEDTDSPAVPPGDDLPPAPNAEPTVQPPEEAPPSPPHVETRAEPPEDDAQSGLQHGSSQDDDASSSAPAFDSPSPPRVDTRVVPPDDDPYSELNVLRREVRQLQAAVRGAGLQIASDQDEIIQLRDALTAADVEAEEGAVREANLRMQLDVQSMKRQQVEATMTAAEALVSSLREMIHESEGAEARVGASDPPDTLGRGSSGRTRKGAARLGESNLDQVLSSIGEAAAEHSQPGHVVVKEQSARVAAPPPNVEDGEQKIAEISFGSLEPSKQSDFTGNTQPVPKTSTVEAKRAAAPPSGEAVIPLAPPSQSFVDRAQPAPLATASKVPQSRRRQTSNLLLSAFRFGPAAVDHQTPAIHSSTIQPGVPLPTEVAAVAKSEGVPLRQVIPSSIAHAVTDAHSGDVFSLAVSADSEWIASGGDDKLVKIYDRNGRPYGTITENTRDVTALAIQTESSSRNPEDVVIYCGGSDGVVRAFRRNVRRKTRWNLEAVVPVHTRAVRKIVVTDQQGMSGNSNMILTCSMDRTIRVCDIEHQKKPFSVTCPSAVLDVSTFGVGHGGLIVSGHKDGALRMWSPDGSGMVGGAKVHSKGVTSVWCLEDGQSVVSLGRDNVVRLSDIRMNIAIVREMGGGAQTVSDWHRCAVRGRLVACGAGRVGSMTVWNVDTGEVVRKVSSQVAEAETDVLDMVARKLRNPGCVVVPVWSASGRFVAAHRTRQVSFWNCS